MSISDLFLDLDAANTEDPDAWMAYGRCAEADPDAWFPEKGGSVRDPKQICRGCEVREKCLEYAIEHDERFGIWGGLSERERRKLRQERAAA